VSVRKPGFAGSSGAPATTDRSIVVKPSGDAAGAAAGRAAATVAAASAASPSHTITSNPSPT
jgi:hypothetical protein